MKKVILIICLMLVAGCQEQVIRQQEKTYDPNDPIYKFIPAADPTWTEMFGDNERTRLIHSISELRVVVSNQGRLLMEMIDPNEDVAVQNPDGEYELWRLTTKEYNGEKIKFVERIDPNET